MQTSVTIPATPKELTPRFFSDVLGCEVASISVNRIGEDESFAGGGLFRIKIAYMSDSQAGPASVVAKFSPTDAAMRLRFATANKREIDFYAESSRETELPTPKYYFGAFDPVTGSSILIIDDLAEFRTVGILEGCTPDEAASVIDALARIHATFWNKPIVASLSGTDLLQEFDFRTAWSTYREKFSTLLPHYDIPESFFELCQFIADNDQVIFGYLWNLQPLTLVHRDTHVDNILFGDSEGVEPAILLDWQLVGKGKGVYDLAFFLISSLEPGRRREIEAPMLARYHDALVRFGVDDYSLDRCRMDFLVSVVGKIYITVIATSFLDNTTPHKIAYREADITRLLAFISDHAISHKTFSFMLD